MTSGRVIKGTPIEHCAFGALRIKGKTYSSDLFIFPDGRIQDGWWRKKGHRLFFEDLAPLLAFRPRLIVVGTGYYGRMVPDPNLEKQLGEAGVELVKDPTCSAAERFNRLSEDGPGVAACFHLTC